MLKKLLLIACTLLNQNSFAQLQIIIRKIEKTDIKQLQECYYAVAATSPNLAIHPGEITHEYVSNMVTAAMGGLGLIVELNGMIIGYMLKQKYPYKSSSHILYGGSIGVHPDFQGKKVGSRLISEFLNTVKEHHKDILRVEIYALESNPAYHLYQKLGFVTEGILKNGKLHSDGKLESYFSMVWFNPNFQASGQA